MTPRVDTGQFTDIQVRHLLNFIGYGRLDAPIWFIGMEEGGGGERNVRARLQFQHVMDCAKAHELLGIKQFHTGKKIIQRTWRGMCHLMLRLEGREPDREAIRVYQADFLGRYNGSTLLAELMPIPKYSIDAWGYEKLIPQYRNAGEYYDKVKPARIRYLRELVREHGPEVVICYGKAFWLDYKQLFPKGIFRPETPFDVGTSDKTLVVMTPHLTARSMNGQFDRLAQVIAGSRGRK